MAGQMRDGLLVDILTVRVPEREFLAAIDLTQIKQLDVQGIDFAPSLDA